jgi:hypothetical protein
MLEWDLLVLGPNGVVHEGVGLVGPGSCRYWGIVQWCMILTPLTGLVSSSYVHLKPLSDLDYTGHFPADNGVGPAGTGTGRRLQKKDVAAVAGHRVCPQPGAPQLARSPGSLAPF